MLVLSRKKNESVVIGDDIVIAIIEIRGEGDSAKVRLGIQAPSEVSVHRKEVYDIIQKQSEQNNE